MAMFPMVPNVPGVPTVARNALNSIGNNVSSSIPGVIGSLTGDFDVLNSDGPGIANVSDGPSWGLFDSDNNLVITPDSFLGMEALKDYKVSDYPVEEGAFASYNKVETPFIGKVTYGKGGDEGERTQFLTDIATAVASLDLYTLVTPEVSYDSVNVTHFDYRRTSKNGVTMLTVEVWVEEIRDTVQASFSNTQQPEGADTSNNGGVQPQTPTASQTAAIGTPT
jgi:hypothetical protein